MAENVLLTNPWNLIYLRMWEMVRNEDGVCGFLLPGNQIDYTKMNGNFGKMHTDSADYPELILVPEGILQIDTESNSNESVSTRQYSWILSGGSFDVSQLYPLEWGIYLALHKWCDVGGLTELQFRGLSFVRQVEIVGVEVGQRIQQVAGKRGSEPGLIKGWTSLWTFNVQCRFNKRLIVSPVGAKVPEAPENLSAVPNVDGNTAFSWDESENSEAYGLYSRTDLSGAFTLEKGTTATSLLWPSPTVTTGYVVRGVNSFGESDPSNEVIIEPAP